jgi:REP element-mobilizing transposase RayT
VLLIHPRSRRKARKIIKWINKQTALKWSRSRGTKNLREKKSKKHKTTRNEARVMETALNGGTEKLKQRIEKRKKEQIHTI